MDRLEAFEKMLADIQKQAEYEAVSCLLPSLSKKKQDTGL